MPFVSSYVADAALQSVIDTFVISPFVSRIFTPSLKDKQDLKPPKSPKGYQQESASNTNTNKDESRSALAPNLDPDLMPIAESAQASHSRTPLLCMTDLGDIWWGLFLRQQSGLVVLKEDGGLEEDKLDVDIRQWNELCDQALGQRWEEWDRDWWAMLRLEE